MIYHLVLVDIWPENTHTHTHPAWGKQQVQLGYGRKGQSSTGESRKTEPERRQDGATKHFWQAFRFSHPWKSHLPASLYYCNLFCDKIPFKKKIHKLHPRKKNLTMESKTQAFEDISLIETWWFSIVMLALRGGSTDFLQPGFLPGIFTPSIHATVQIPSSADLRLEHWIHACAIQDISGLSPQGSSWDTPLNPKIPQKATQSKEIKIGNDFMQKIRFFRFRTLFLSAGFAETSASFQTIGTIHQGDHTRRRSNHLGAQSFKYTDQPCCIAAWHSIKKKRDFLLLAWKILYQHSMVRYA